MLSLSNHLFNYQTLDCNTYNINQHILLEDNRTMNRFRYKSYFLWGWTSSNMFSRCYTMSVIVTFENFLSFRFTFNNVQKRKLESVIWCFHNLRAPAILWYPIKNMGNNNHKDAVFVVIFHLMSFCWALRERSITNSHRKYKKTSILQSWKNIHMK